MAVVRIHLLPEQPFGGVAGGGRTLAYQSAAAIRFNANSGVHEAISEEPFPPVDVTIEAPDQRMTQKGRTFQLERRVRDLASLERTLESLFFGYPWLLNLTLADPLYVERVEGTIGDVPFGWELAHWECPLHVASVDTQEVEIVKAWNRLNILAADHRRRLQAALHYLHIARRLSRVSATPGEFISEAVLNYSKTLEVLFPGPQSIESARKGLGELGFEDAEIESQYVPALALRNQIDVGHVHLAALKRDQLDALHSYVDAMEHHFVGLLNRVFDRIEKSDWDVEPYTDLEPRPEAVEVIERIQASVAKGL